MLKKYTALCVSFLVSQYFPLLRKVIVIVVVADESGPQHQDSGACSRRIHLLRRGYIHLR